MKKDKSCSFCYFLIFLSKYRLRLIIKATDQL